MVSPSTSTRTQSRTKLMKPEPDTPFVLSQLSPFPLGQPLAEHLLGTAIAQSKLASAYLFTGPTGVGKALAARWMAAQLLYGARRSESRRSGASFVQQVVSGSYPDLVWVEPETTGKCQIKLEQVQSLRRQLQETSLGNHWVAVIDGADRLTSEAGNALLKLLEDRMACTFILIATHPQQVLQTVRSRCQTVRFGPLGQADLQSVLCQHCPELLEHESLLRCSGGSPGRAIELWNCLIQIPVALRERLQQFAPAASAPAVVEALHLARELAGLEWSLQQALLQVWIMHPRPLPLTQLLSQAQHLLDAQVNPQGVWELLLVGCALKGLGWTTHLPLDQGNEPPAGGKDRPPESDEGQRTGPAELPESVKPQRGQENEIPLKPDESQQISLF